MGSSVAAGQPCVHAAQLISHQLAVFHILTPHLLSSSTAGDGHTCLAWPSSMDCEQHECCSHPLLGEHLVPPAEAQEQCSSRGQGSHQQTPHGQQGVPVQQEGAVQDAGHLDVAPATNRCGLGADLAGTTLS